MTLNAIAAIERPPWYRPLCELWNNRNLIHSLVIASEKSTFNRMSVGPLWKYIEPAFFILTYYVFIVVVRGSESVNSVHVIAVIMSGLMIFEWIRKTLIASSTILLSYQALATATSIPLVCLIATGFYQNTRSTEPLWLMSILVIVGGFHGFSLHLLGLPLLLLLLGFCLLPLSIIAAYLGAYFRDMPRVLELMMRIAIFVSPVLFDMSSVPAKLAPLLALNPITYFIEAARDMLWRDALPSLISTVAVAAYGIVLWQIALLLLQRVGRRVVKVL